MDRSQIGDVQNQIGDGHNQIGDGHKLDWRWTEARLEMDRSQIIDGRKPDWRWKKARLEMDRSQLGDGQKPIRTLLLINSSDKSKYQLLRIENSTFS